jgi:hypothetical protein
MKKILCVLLFFGGVIINAQNPIALNLRAGYSETKGLLGAEFQVSNFSISGGWKPQKLWEQKVNSYSAAFTYYINQWYKSGLYGSIGFSSKGYFYAESLYSPNTPGSGYTIEPSLNLLVGMRLNLKDVISAYSPRYIVDAGVGVGASEHTKWIALEFIFNFNLYNNHIRRPKFCYK